MIYQSHQLSEALAMITQEDVIVFPTDTVYGIGASIHSPNALDKIFEIKNSVEQIANELDISVNTVYFHLRNIAKQEDGLE